MGTHYSYTGVRTSCALQARSTHINVQDRLDIVKLSVSIPIGDYLGIRANPDIQQGKREYIDLKIIHSYMASVFAVCGIYSSIGNGTLAFSQFLV